MTRIVTDSTASLPAGMAQELGIEVIPLHVVIDGQTYLEGVDCSPEQIAAALGRGAQVSTSQPNLEQFAQVYARLAQEGAQEIVSVHLSGALSGTVATAQAAATDARVKVHVVDSRSAAMGLGFAVLAAARRAAQPQHDSEPESGHSGARIAAVAEQAAHATRAVFMVDSIEHLRRGGRLGRAASAVGTLLGLRPLLTLDDGEIVVLQKIRTRHLAQERLLELARTEAAMRSVPQIAIHHDGHAQDAEELAGAVAQATGAEVLVSPVSAVLGAHAGPGLLAIVVGGAI